MALKRQQGAGLPRETQPQTCCQHRRQRMQASITHTKTMQASTTHKNFLCGYPIGQGLSELPGPLIP